MARTAHSNGRASGRKDDLREAEEAIVDQRTFFLDSEQHERFLEMLATPPAPLLALEELMTRKRIWNR